MRQWYATPEGQTFLAATEQGRFAFTWKAVNSDGTEEYQFPEETRNRLFSDPSPFAETKEMGRKAVDFLDVRKVEEMIFLPTAPALKYAPWLRPIRLVVDVEAGEKFINFWLVDRDAMTGVELARVVVGISKPVNGAQVKFFTIISPTGSVVVTTKENLSIEGE